MYAILTEQRGAQVVRVPAAGRWTRASPSTSRPIRAAVRAADAGAINLIWLCNPNNPTATTEPAGVIESLLDGLLADAEADGRQAPVVLLDEAYVEFGGETELPLRERYPAPCRRPDAEQGLRDRRPSCRVRDRAAGDDRRDLHVSAAGLRLDRLGRRRGRAPAQ